ncbi:hypothetical protein [Halomonas salipaludis]|uniref:hypothetical protein n=1 Tax=Halomonas salipaludis TaxID=2032625 RepID=UPI0011409DDD|nr:hypothetical protein [Halomonas salipaludis]
MAKSPHSEALPEPTLGQPHRAGDTERIGTSKVTYLAPLPLPTGMPPVDVSQAIGNLNDTWLDYGAGSPNVFVYQYTRAFILVF